MTEHIIEIAVIDDLKNGAAYFSPLERIPDHPCNVNFIGVDNCDPLEKLKKAITTGPIPDVVLIDHVLDKTSEASKAFLQRGGSLVPILREHWGECPVLAITAEPEDCKKEVGSDNYEEIFDRMDLVSLAQFLPSVVAGYREARNIRTPSDLIEKFGVPEAEKIVFLKALPDSLKDYDVYGTPKFIHTLYRWFREVLYVKSGFLYEEKWAAITIGVDEDHFPSFSDKISDCLYNGIWADPAGPRWWKSLLYASARGGCDDPRATIQKAASETFEIEEKYFSRCYSCGEIWPGVLAYIDETAMPAERQAMHRRCSEPHPCRQGLPYFEEERVMVEAS